MKLPPFLESQRKKERLWQRIFRLVYALLFYNLQITLLYSLLCVPLFFCNPLFFSSLCFCVAFYCCWSCVCWCTCVELPKHYLWKFIILYISVSLLYILARAKRIMRRNGCATTNVTMFHHHQFKIVSFFAASSKQYIVLCFGPPSILTREKVKWTINDVISLNVVYMPTWAAVAGASPAHSSSSL